MLTVLPLAGALLAVPFGPTLPHGVAMAAPSISTHEKLRAADSWGYQLQGVEPRKLVASQCDVVVIDYSRDGSDAGAFSRRDLALVHAQPQAPIVLAYLSIGEAESYRFYWQQAWLAPNSRPAWLGEENRQWPANYHVRYWDPDWQSLIFGSPDSYLDRIIAAGFDGVYLDRVDAYDDWDGSHDPADKMIDFVTAISRYARTINPDFVVVPQNGEQLLRAPRYRAAIDGVGKEDLFFGVARDGTRNPAPETAASLSMLRLALADGLPVFLVEYLRDPAKITEAAQRARHIGLVPFFSDRELDTTIDCRRR